MRSKYYVKIYWSCIFILKNICEEKLGIVLRLVKEKISYKSEKILGYNKNCIINLIKNIKNLLLKAY